MWNDSNPVENLGFNEYRSRACKLTIHKFRRFNGGRLNPPNLPYMGTPVVERGKKIGGNVGKEVSAGKKRIKGKWSVYLQPVHETG